MQRAGAVQASSKAIAQQNADGTLGALPFPIKVSMTFIREGIECACTERLYPLCDGPFGGCRTHRHSPPETDLEGGASKPSTL
ncbi:MAG: hypothetical protein CSB44_04710 [Gammaproteobacteria bacterium]|nr:MAG: hypothetical protein CSB44_04710 [Gammaproteobacteria bacterium]